MSLGKIEKWEARVLSAVLSAPVTLNSVKASAGLAGRNPTRRRSKNRQAAETNGVLSDGELAIFSAKLFCLTTSDFFPDGISSGWKDDRKRGEGEGE